MKITRPMRLLLPLVFVLACSSSSVVSSDAASNDAAHAGAGGATAGHGGAGGGGDAAAGAGGAPNCATVGCSAPPLCGQACTATCGCCACGEGERQGDLVCHGGCWAAAGADGGESDAADGRDASDAAGSRDGALDTIPIAGPCDPNHPACASDAICCQVCRLGPSSVPICGGYTCNRPVTSASGPMCPLGA